MTPYKTPFIITLIVLIACILIYFFWLKPSDTQLERGQAEQVLISQSEQIIKAKDSVISKLQDSLENARNNVKVIKGVVYKEKAGIIGEVATDERMERFKAYLGDFYDSQTHEIGVEPAPLGKLTLTLNEKEYKGGELLKSSYEGEKKINFQLTNELTFQDKIIENKDIQLDEKDKIIGLKETQLRKLEGTKVPVINSRKWYVDFAIIAGSLAVGFTTGIIYQNNK